MGEIFRGVLFYGRGINFKLDEVFGSNFLRIFRALFGGDFPRGLIIHKRNVWTDCPVELCGLLVRIPCRITIGAAVVIWAMVNTHTHIHTDRERETDFD